MMHLALTWPQLLGRGEAVNDKHDMSKDQVDDMFSEMLDMEKIVDSTKAPEVSEPAGPMGISLQDAEALQAKASDAPMDFYRDLEWAYQNLGNESPRNPPSHSALHLLAYGTSARTDFMKMISNYMLKKAKEKEAEDARRDDKRTQMKFIDTLREEMDGVSRDMMSQASDETLIEICQSRGVTVGS